MSRPKNPTWLVKANVEMEVSIRVRAPGVREAIAKAKGKKLKLFNAHNIEFDAWSVENVPPWIEDGPLYEGSDERS